MIPSTKEEFLSVLRSGDIGIILGKNFFARLQDWYRKKFSEGALAASHGFYLRQPPRIAEANGVFVRNDATIIKNIGDQTKCWVFRHMAVTDQQIAVMNAAADMAVMAGGHYSVGGIGEFALRFFNIHKALSDESGVFCTEFTSDLIEEAGIPYVDDKRPYEIDPSYQLNWMLGEGIKKGWFLAAFYDGEGNYQIDPALKGA